MKSSLTAIDHEWSTTMHDHTSIHSDDDAATRPVVEVVSSHDAPPMPASAEIMTIRVTLPPGSAGTPPHRHSGPAFGYVIRGEMRFELEGEPERVIAAGGSFWEPGGDVIHYQDANNSVDTETEFVVMMFGLPGEPMLTVVDADELEARKPRRAPRP